jgi:hypothetical protein
VSRHVENALIGPFLQDPPGELDAITVRHDDVYHQQIHAPSCLTQHFESFGAVFGFQHPVAFFAENAIGDAAGESLVINDEESGVGGGKRN